MPLLLNGFSEHQLFARCVESVGEDYLAPPHHSQQCQDILKIIFKMYIK